MAFLDALREACGVRSANGSEDKKISAAGIYVEVRVDEGADEDLDDILLEDLGMVLDTAEQMLKDVEFLLALHTSNALLAVKRLGTDDGDISEAAATELGRAVVQTLATRPGADARVHVNVAVRFDDVIIRTRASGEREVIGGSLLALETWAPEENIAELDVSRGSSRPSGG